MIIPLPQYWRPGLSHDGTGQHSTLTNCHRGDSHFLVLRKAEPVDICRLEEKMFHIIAGEIMALWLGSGTDIVCQL